MTKKTDPYSRIVRRGKDVQYVFPFEIDQLLGDLSSLKSENKDLWRKAILMDELFEIIVSLVSDEKNRVPCLNEFEKMTGLDMNRIYRYDRFFPRYTKVAKALGLKVRRSPRKTKKIKKAKKHVRSKVPSSTRTDSVIHPS